MFVPKASSRRLVLLVPPVQCYLARGLVVGALEDSNVTEIANYQVNCDQWRVIHINKEFIEWTWIYKMCIVCILFLLAVHRLVLIVNSWDVLGGTGEGRKVIPILLKQCFAQAWWILPYLFFFYLYFPWVGGVEKGSVLQCWRTRRVEDYDKEKNNISPWRKKLKKNQWLFCVFRYLLMLLNVLIICDTCGSLGKRRDAITSDSVYTWVRVRAYLTTTAWLFYTIKYWFVCHLAPSTGKLW